ncbi:uncharacterized protein LOC121777476 [Salvia splendens]|uniref:uncharacterized protein LOC121777476 n=1 Tax=Salvia splendens TaxID=180675 RepID=UPI001C2746DC|nr:uncharacterized protein LOC121777476 [Salvia splendens]XP_042030685.1 uncharacterized protein LOC121777476 [Salvia splendens]
MSSRGLKLQRGQECPTVSVEERSMWKAAERGVSIMDCVYESFSDIHRFKDGRYTYKRAANVDAKVQEIAAMQGENANLNQIFINDVFGGKLDRKKRMFGTGNLAKSLVGGRTPGLNAHAPTGIHLSVRQELREELWEEMRQELNVDGEQRTKLENDVAMMQEMMRLFMTTARKSSHASDSSVEI